MFEFEVESNISIKDSRLLRLDRVSSQKCAYFLYFSQLFLYTLLLLNDWFMGLRSNFNSRGVNAREDF